MKSLIWVVVIVAVIVAAFFLFRGRPAGEQPGDLTSTPAATPVTPESGAQTAPPSASAATIAITAAGFSPARVTVPAGSPVTFVNNDTAPHQVASIPHPVHTAHPPLNGDVLAAGATFTVSFPTAGTYGYHDHPNPGVTGSIVVQ